VAERSEVGRGTATPEMLEEVYKNAKT